MIRININRFWHKPFNRLVAVKCGGLCCFAAFVLLSFQPEKEEKKSAVCFPIAFNNGQFFTTGGFVFNDSLSALLFTAQIPEKDSAGIFFTGIFISYKQPQGWSSPVRITPNDGYFYGGPCWDEKNKRIFFHSNRGDWKMSDRQDFNIWTAVLKQNELTNLQLAAGVNTTADERYPRILPGGELYFQVEANGNADIFRYNFSQPHNKPVALAAFNTTLPEVSVFVDNDEQTAIVTRRVNRHQPRLFLYAKKGDQWVFQRQIAIPNQRIYGEANAYLNKSGNLLFFQSGQTLFQVCADVMDNKMSLPPATHHPYKHRSEIKTPIAFANGSFQTVNGIAFSANGQELYTSEYNFSLPDSSSNAYVIQIKRSEFKNGRWGMPVSFDFNEDWLNYHPVLSPDGNKLFFNSRRPVPGTNAAGAKNDIWYSRLINGRWEEPEWIRAFATADHDDYISIANDGTAFFRSDRKKDRSGEIYVSYWKNGEYTDPQPVTELNSEFNENDVCVDPKKRFIIFNRFFQSTRELDMYISFRGPNDRWTEPRALDIINSKMHFELTPTLSPDGKYFFFEKRGMIMQIELKHLLLPGELKYLH